MKRGIVVTTLFVIILLSQNLAQIYEYEYRPPDSVDADGLAKYKLYIGDNNINVKGIYCFLPGWQGSSLYIVNYQSYRDLVDEEGFALMGVEMLGAYTDFFNGVRLWSGEAFIKALRELAVLSGKPEIEFAPLFFDGHSAGGQFSYHFTLLKPERVIGFVTMKGGVHSLEAAGNAVKVPGFMFIGENDKDYRIANLTTIFESERLNGALWSLAIDPDARHDRVSKEIVHIYFKNIISLRIPNVIPADTIPSLNECKEEDGWLGDRGNFYTIQPYMDYYGEKTEACWFPNEEIAQAWKEFTLGIPLSSNTQNAHNPEFSFSLSNNYPNPFNPSTTIKYSIPKNSNVTIRIFDVLGKEVSKLINKEQPQGKYEIDFDGSDRTSGIYFYRLQAGDFVETKKMILMK